MDLIGAIVAIIFRIVQFLIGSLVPRVSEPGLASVFQQKLTAICFSVRCWSHLQPFSVRRHVLPDERWEQDDGWSNTVPIYGRSYLPGRPIFN